MVDECFAMCCSAAIPHTVIMTAKLDVNYKVPVRSLQYIVLTVQVTEVEGRKVRLVGEIESLQSCREEARTVLATASALFVSPKYNAVSLYVQPRGELVPTRIKPLLDSH